MTLLGVRFQATETHPYAQTVAEYRIICVNKVEVKPGGHIHIAQVGTDGPKGPIFIWTVGMIDERLDQGDSFFILAHNEKVAVYPYRCAKERCGFDTIRTAPGTGDALENLPACA